MKIYTKKGDNLRTSAIQKQVYKDDVVIHIVGNLDELSASLMVSYHFIEDGAIKEIILMIIQDLFKVSPEIMGYENAEKISEERLVWLENLIDEYSAKLNQLTTFIIQGMNKASSHLHLSRAISRRLERWIVKYAREHGLSKLLLSYLNRLSDLLFTLARFLDQ